MSWSRSGTSGSASSPTSSVPDLKEAEGGLRDATVLKALVATWLVDVPHADLERSRLAMLDVRDVLHDVAGRATDRIAPEQWGDLAAGARPAGRTRAAQVPRPRAGSPDHPPVAADLAAGRRRPDATGPASAAADPALDPDRARASRSPRARSCSTAGPGPSEDPLLLLRAAAEAAERDVVLAPATAARLVREAAPLPDPVAGGGPPARWCGCSPSGRGLLGVWETLEETGALALVLPEWERIRLLPHASAIHRFTVDRHVVETCIEASALIRHVARPDVLMVAALLHDIGKGGLTEHSVAGEPIARAIATRMGFDAAAVDADRPRWSAGTCCSRRPRRPATRRTRPRSRCSPSVSATRRPPRLLLALTEADARATSPKAWSSWRAGLISDLGRRVLAAFDDAAPERPSRDVPELPCTPPGDGEVVISVEQDADGVAGHGRGPRPGRPARRLRRRCSRCSGRRFAPRAPGLRESTPSPCGTSPTSWWPLRCYGSASTPSPTARVDPTARLSRGQAGSTSRRVS